MKYMYITYMSRKCLIRLSISSITVGVLIYFYSFLPDCTKLILFDTTGKQRPKFLCMKFQGGLGNHMFQYSFAYGVSKEKHLNLLISDDNMLTQYFHIMPNKIEDYGYDRRLCSCFWKGGATLDCGYDETMMRNIPDTDLSFEGYFQSWKYWIKYENQLRKSFTFKSYVTEKAESQLKRILFERNITIGDGTAIVGLHIRNGDYSKREFAKYGYRVPPKSYVLNASDYFRKLFIKVLFIVCTNEPKWTTEILSGQKDYFIVKNNPAEVDMALLSMTNHTIMTVGTYGWMIAWLTGGTTIYYKYPYIEGSKFGEQFHSNYSDHFYPGWISME